MSSPELESTSSMVPLSPLVDLLFVVVLDLLTLSSAANAKPNRSTWRSLAGLSAVCSSMFSDRAPAPPRFIGHTTWMCRELAAPKAEARRAAQKTTIFCGQEVSCRSDRD